MSTKCRIGIENKDKTITSIYCHFDGYLDGVGKKLLEHYQDESKIRKLMELGDLSSLGDEPVSNPDAWKRSSMMSMKDIKTHNPENMCNDYASRGEDCPAIVSKSLKDYHLLSQDSWASYTYLFKDNKWYVISELGCIPVIEALAWSEEING